jgi:hypothetical protein
LNESVEGFNDKPEAEKDVAAFGLAAHRGMWRPLYEKLMHDAGEETYDDNAGRGVDT